MKFKPGDRVICINLDSSVYMWTPPTGKIYTVHEGPWLSKYLLATPLYLKETPVSPEFAVYNASDFIKVEPGALSELECLIYNIPYPIPE